jgi:hypothetical protein
LYEKLRIPIKNDGQYLTNYSSITDIASKATPPNRNVTKKMSTTEIINDFVNKVDTEKEYTLKELKDALDEVYKTHAAANKAEKKQKKPTKTTKAAPKEDLVEPKAKRAPSAYNKFVKQRIQQLKQEQEGIPPKDLMKMAAAEWKNLTKQEQEEYK